MIRASLLAIPAPASSFFPGRVRAHLLDHPARLRASEASGEGFWRGTHLAFFLDLSLIIEDAEAREAVRQVDSNGPGRPRGKRVHSLPLLALSCRLAHSR